jgi:hypothetical protein
LPVGRGDFPDKGTEPAAFRRQIRGHHGRTLLRQNAGDGASNALRSARDDGDLTLKADVVGEMKVSHAR